MFRLWGTQDLWLITSPAVPSNLASKAQVMEITMRMSSFYMSSSPTTQTVLRSSGVKMKIAFHPK